MVHFLHDTFNLLLLVNIKLKLAKMNNTVKIID